MKFQPNNRSSKRFLILILAFGGSLVGCSPDSGTNSTAITPEAGDSAPNSALGSAPESSDELHPDLILVSIDACRPDRTSAYGYNRPTTPALAQLASEGMLFEHAYTTMPLALPALTSVMTGALPAVHGVRDDVECSLTDSWQTLSEVLAARGYRTGAFVGSRNLHAKYGLDRGFEHYDDDIASTVLFGKDPASREDEAVVARADEWLDGLADEPVFLFAQLSAPTAPPESSSARSDSIDDPYDARISAADSALASLIAALRKHDRYEDSLIIVTSSSGEALGDHGEIGHGFLLHESTVRIPLVVRAPGGGKAVRIASPASLIDLYSTFLSAAGVTLLDAPGVDLLTLVESPQLDRMVYSESVIPTRYGYSAQFSLISSNWKYIHSTAPALYNLERDPDESDNLFESEKERASSMQSMLMKLSPNRKLTGPPAPEFVREHGLISQFPAMLAGGKAGSILATCDELDFAHPEMRALAYWRVQAEIRETFYNRNEPSIDLLKEFLIQYPVRRKPAKSRLEPFSSAACLELGARLVEDFRGSESIHPLRDALQVRPRETAGHLALGEAFLQIERSTQAVQSLLKAARIESTADLENTLGTAYSREGAVEDALKHYERAVKLAPDHALYHANLARCYMFHQRWGDAGNAYRRSVELDPDKPEVQLELGFFLATVKDESLQNHREAVQHVELALKGGLPMRANALDGVATVYARVKAYDLALKFSERALEQSREEGDRKLEGRIFEHYKELTNKVRMQQRE